MLVPSPTPVVVVSAQAGLSLLSVWRLVVVEVAVPPVGGPDPQPPAQAVTSYRLGAGWPRDAHLV
jgi:hypothetical protein